MTEEKKGDFLKKMVFFSTRFGRVAEKPIINQPEVVLTTTPPNYSLVDYPKYTPLIDRNIPDLHRFSWLRSLKEINDKKAKQHACEITHEWINHFSAWNKLSWDPITLSERLYLWIQYFDFLNDPVSLHYTEKLFDSFNQQLRFLFRYKLKHIAKEKRFKAIKTMIAASLYIEKYHDKLKKASQLLDQEILGQFYDDGGHYSRSPQIHFEILQDLLEIQIMFEKRQKEIPERLSDEVKKLTSIVSFLRHGDGGFCIFNGTNEGNSSEIERLLKHLPSPEVIKQLPDTAFEKVVRDKTSLFFYHGSEANEFKGTMSFEMSIARQRIIVNCGCYTGVDDNWGHAMTSTAAHSIMCINEHSMENPSSITCERKEQEGNIWIESSHNGYLHSDNIMVYRRLYLNEKGTELRGEDKIVGKIGTKFDLRFHLHPLIKSSLLPNGQHILLQLPNGMGWRFLSSANKIDISESVYFGNRDKQKRTEQIVVSDTTKEKITVVKWALKRME